MAHHIPTNHPRVSTPVGVAKGCAAAAQPDPIVFPPAASSIRHMSGNVFNERLEQAISNLTIEQQDSLLARAPGARGLKAAIAQVAGLPSPNVLSDILAGRASGSKYRQPLADAVATDLAWMEGTGDIPPDWALSPVAAWCRFSKRLEEAAQRARFLTGREQSTLPVPTGNHRERSDAEVLARDLDHDPRDPALIDLVKGVYTKPPAPLLWRYAVYLGISIPIHAKHLERGRELWHACEDELAKVLEQANARFQRMLPSPALFRLMRAALVDWRQSQLYQGEDCQPIEDAMELLWVQQWFLHGRQRWQVPKAFTEETGRRAWSKLRDIQARYAGDADIEGRYRPRRIPRPPAAEQPR